MMGSAALLCVLSLLEAVAGSALDDRRIRTAVDAWLSDSAAAEATYGHISTWDTSGVTDMSDTAIRLARFNEDIHGMLTFDNLLRPRPSKGPRLSWTTTCTHRRVGIPPCAH